MNKAEIIQRLLDGKHITVEEAMILMSQEPTPMMPMVPVWPNQYQPPFNVGDPDWTWDPNRNPIWYTTSTNTSVAGSNSNIGYSDTKWPTDSE